MRVALKRLRIPAGPVNIFWKVVIILSVILVFLCDLITPLGFAHGTVYVPIVLLTLLLRRRKFLYAVAGTAILLTLTGLFTSPPHPPGFPYNLVVANRLFSIVVIIITTLLIKLVIAYFEHQQEVSSKVQGTLKQLEDQEHYFRGLIQGLQEDILVIDRNYVITDVNSKFLDSVSLGRDEVIGKKCFEISHQYDRSCDLHEESSLLQDVFLSGKPANRLHTYVRPDKSQAHVDILFSPVQDAEGTVTHIVQAMRDVTELVQGQLDLHQQESLLQLAGETALFGGWSADLAENTVYWSETVARIHEMPPGYMPTIEEGIGFFAPEYRNMITERFNACVQKGESFNVELEIITAGGKRVWVNSVGTPIYGESGEIQGVQGAFQDITERKLMADSLREREVHFRTAVEGSPIAIFVQTDYRFAYLNLAACSLFGAESPEVLLGTPVIERFHPSVHEIVRERIRLLNEEGTPVPEIEEIFVSLDGREIPVEVSAVPFTFMGRHGALVFAHDITSRKEAEAAQEQLRTQLTQAQKMETLGRLAGGVAHDFNNMLGVIIGYAELALDKFEPDNTAVNDLKEIRQAAVRSAEITKQLLAFARQQTITPAAVSISKKVNEMLNMLKQLVGENIEITFKPGKNVWKVLIDHSQLDQVLLNLIVNARDAIDKRGNIFLETGVVTFDEKYCSKHYEFLPGEYVFLAVSDDGHGMTSEVKENIFEPFFTTKERHKGSGLGLPTIYGIVRQNKGFINVYSEPGKGTSFKIYFPRHIGSIDTVQKQPAESGKSKRGEGILVVEDEAAILTLTTSLLEGLGYTVYPALTSEAALEKAKKYCSSIDLLITDVVMPGMTGRELSEALNKICPDIQTLYMSGYTADIITHRGVLDQGINFIQKPFSLSQLSGKVKDILESG